MSELAEVLAAFHEATACDAAVWRRDTEGTPLKYVAGTARGDPPLDADGVRSDFRYATY